MSDRSPEKSDSSEKLIGMSSAELAAALLLEQRRSWNTGDCISTEQYLHEYPVLGSDSDNVLDLIYNEVVLREERDDSPSCQEYVSRFPHLELELHRLFQVHYAIENSEGIEQTTLPPNARADSLSTETNGIPVIPGYRIVEEVGRGGMGVVYRAQQSSANRIVALKLILAGQFASEKDIARFHQEAKAAARLDHPGIVPVYEVGECRGTHFYSMPFVDGGNLADVLSLGPMKVRHAATLIREIAEAIHCAHSHGVVHRDLKPANVLVPSNGDRTRITDFGLATQLDQTTNLTQTGAVLGTPNYLSPEQATGKQAQVGPLSDLFSLGAMLYHALTGRPPFQGHSALEVLNKVVNDAPVSLTILNNEVSRDLETICLKAIHKDPQRRYSSAAAFGEELSRFLDGKPVLARPVTRAERITLWSRRYPALAAMSVSLVLLLVLIATGATYAAFQLHREQQRAIRAERSANEKLLLSYLSEALALQRSGRPGRRWDSLETIRDANELASRIDADKQVVQELRNAAIASLALADLRIASQFKGYHDKGVVLSGIAIDDDVTQYAKVDAESFISIRALANDQELLRFPGIGSVHNQPKLIFSPGARYLAAKSHQNGISEIRVWDLSESLPPCVFKAQTVAGTFAEDFCFSPNGLDIAFIGSDHSISIHDLKSDTLKRRLPVGTGIQSLRYHPNGSRIAVCNESGVRVLDHDNGQVVTELPGHDTLFVEWNQNGTMLATFGAPDNLVHIWDTMTWTQVGSMSGHTATVLNVDFSQDNATLASTSWDGTTRLWDVASGDHLLTSPGHCLQFSRNDEWLGFGFIGSEIGRWQFAPSEVRRVLRHSDDAELVSTSISPDGMFVATSNANGVHIWDRNHSTLLSTLPLKGGSYSAFDPSTGDLITWGWTGLQRWPLHMMTEKITAKRPRELRIGPPTAVNPELEFSGVEPFTVSLNGDVFAVKLDFDTTAVFHNDLRRPNVRLLKHTPHAFVALSPDGLLAATGNWNGHGVKVWMTESGRLLRTLLASEQSANVVFSPDSRWLVIGTERAYYFVDTMSLEIAHELDRVKTVASASPMSFTHDGRTLALGYSPNGIRLADPTTILEHFTLPALSPPTLLEISQQGDCLVTKEDRNSISVWDIAKVDKKLADLGLKSRHSISSIHSLVTSRETDNVGDELLCVIVDLGALTNSLTPGNPEHSHLSGVQSLRSNQHSEAIKWFTDAIRKQPTYPSAWKNWYMRAISQSAMGQWHTATRDYSEAIDKCDDSSSLAILYRERAIAYHNIRQLNQSKLDYEKLLHLEPNNPENYSRFATLLRDEESDSELLDRDAAYDLMTKAIELAPDNIQYRLDRVADCRSTSRFGDIIEDLDAILKLRPDDHRTSNSLGWLLATCPDRTFIDAHRAEQLARRAVQLAPQRGNYRNTLGVAHYRNGSWQSSLDALNESIKLTGGDSWDWFFMAMAHSKLDNPEAARRNLARAINWMMENRADNVELLRIRDEARELIGGK